MAQVRSRYEIRGGGRFVWVPRVEWDEHRDLLAETWKPGDHVSLFAPTDHGKTHLVLKGLAPIWPKDYPWLTIDVKGDDPSLARWGHPIRKKIPGRMLRDRLYEDQRFRLVVPEAIEMIKDAREWVVGALRTARSEKGWIVHLNEVRALSDPKPPGLDLAPRLEQLWLRGRPHITVIAETQRGAWVPGSMYDQPSHIYIGGFTDGRMKDRLAEIGGDTDNVIRAIGQLQEHEFLYVNRRGTMQIVKAPA
jgi:hypothetical protein